MTHEREIAGIVVGVAGIVLIFKGEYLAALGLLGPLLGFFMGEKNGERKAVKNKDQGT